MKLKSLSLLLSLLMFALSISLFASAYAQGAMTSITDFNYRSEVTMGYREEVVTYNLRYSSSLPYRYGVATDIEYQNASGNWNVITGADVSGHPNDCAGLSYNYKLASCQFAPESNSGIEQLTFTFDFTSVGVWKLRAESFIVESTSSGGIVFTPYGVSQLEFTVNVLPNVSFTTMETAAGLTSSSSISVAFPLPPQTGQNLDLSLLTPIAVIAILLVLGFVAYRKGVRVSIRKKK